MFAIDGVVSGDVSQPLRVFWWPASPPGRVTVSGRVIGPGDPIRLTGRTVLRTNRLTSRQPRRVTSGPFHGN